MEPLALSGSNEMLVAMFVSPARGLRHEYAISAATNTDYAIAADRRAVAVKDPAQSLLVDGVVGLVGVAWGSGVAVALTTLCTAWAKTIGSPSSRKWMNHTRGSKS